MEGALHAMAKQYAINTTIVSLDKISREVLSHKDEEDVVKTIV